MLGSGTLLEVNAFKPGQIETFYASQQIGEHPLTKDLNLEGELFCRLILYSCLKLKNRKNYRIIFAIRYNTNVILLKHVIQHCFKLKISINN